MNYTAGDFWNWFMKNNEPYLSLDELQEDEAEELMSAFMDELNKYSEELYFQIGGEPNKTTELIITAEGNIEYFDKVEELVNAAPVIDNWEVIAFKQAIAGHSVSDWGSFKINSEDLYFIPLTNIKDIRLNIQIFVKGYEAIEHFEEAGSAVLVILDSILGEKNFALNIGEVEILPLKESDKVYPILDLPGYLENYMQEKKN